MGVFVVTTCAPLLCIAHIPNVSTQNTAQVQGHSTCGLWLFIMVEEKRADEGEGMPWSAGWEAWRSAWPFHWVLTTVGKSLPIGPMSSSGNRIRSTCSPGMWS